MCFITNFFIFAGWLHIQPGFLPILLWFKNIESRLNHHLSGLFGFSSFTWARHIIHIAIPASRGKRVDWFNFLIVIPHPRGLIPFIIGKWIIYAKDIDNITYVFGTNRDIGLSIITFMGGFHPITQSLWLSDIAHHHISISILFILVGHIYRSKFNIGHSIIIIINFHISPIGKMGKRHRNLYFVINNSFHFQIGLALASLGTVSSLVAQHMYSLSSYVFLMFDFTRQRALYTHHQYIAGCIVSGAFAHGAIFFIRDYKLEKTQNNVLSRILNHKEVLISHLSWISLFLGFHTLRLYVHNDIMQAFGIPESQILIEPLFAQWIQFAHGKSIYDFEIFLASPSNFLTFSKNTWLRSWLRSINNITSFLFFSIGPGDFLIHHAISLGLHITTLISMKSALDRGSSKLIPDKKDFGYSFSCDGPGRGGTCDISAWDSFYLAVFWILNTIGWVTFYWHWKNLNIWQGNINQFRESSTYLIGWLRDYLWLNSSQLINGYNSLGINDLSVWAWIFLFGHLIYATRFIFLISWRGYWQELIETLIWSHERIPLTNLFRWYNKPVALSIVQARFIGLIHFLFGYVFTYAAFLVAATSRKFG